MSDTEKKDALREILSSDFATLKSSKKGIVEEDKLDALAKEKNVLVEHGNSAKKISEIINAMKGETISDEHVEMVKKYLDYLRGQLSTVNANIKSVNEEREIENFL